MSHPYLLFMLIIFEISRCSVKESVTIAIIILLFLIAVIDLKFRIIPNWALIFLIVLGISLPSEVDIRSRFFGVFIISVPLMLLNLKIRDGIGGGDIKLFAVSGFILGVELNLLVFVVSVFLGGLHGVYAKMNNQKYIPFGQYIAVGIIISLLAGEDLIKMYLDFWGL